MKRQQTRRRLMNSTILAGALVAGLLPHLLVPAPAAANPEDGEVVAGEATISGLGSNFVLINQKSQKAILEWGSFNIAAGERTHFEQPGTSASALNRITDQNPSLILGSLTATGSIYLINPNGIMFGEGSTIDVHGLVATSANITDQDYLAGRLSFSGGFGPITNRGTITAAEGGLVALIGSHVANDGIISARLGQVHLASASMFTLDFYGDSLLSIAIEDGADSSLDGALVENSGLIEAAGGIVHLTAGTARDVLDNVVNMDGIIDVSSVETRGGEIFLTGGNAAVSVSGTLDASSGADAGGNIQITGATVALTGNATIDASGASGGGTILVGGDYQGGGVVPTASRTYVGAEVSISADAGDAGDGGKVIIWADEATAYFGQISATGGAQSGNGGFVEVSGKDVLTFEGSVDLSAPAGEAGTLLLDPTDIILVGTNDRSAGVTIDLTDVDNFLDADLSGETTRLNVLSILGIDGELVLQATRDVIFDQSIDESADLDVDGLTAITVDAGRNIEVHADINFDRVLDGGEATRITLRADSPFAPGGSDGIGSIIISPNGVIGADIVELMGAAFDIQGIVTGGRVTLSESTGGVFTIGTTISAADLLNISARLQIGFINGEVIIGAGSSELRIDEAYDFNISNGIEFGFESIRLRSDGDIVVNQPFSISSTDASITYFDADHDGDGAGSLIVNAPIDVLFPYLQGADWEINATITTNNNVRFLDTTTQGFNLPADPRLSDAELGMLSATGGFGLDLAFYTKGDFTLSGPLPVVADLEFVRAFGNITIAAPIANTFSFLDLSADWDRDGAGTLTISAPVSADSFVDLGGADFDITATVTSGDEEIGLSTMFLDVTNTTGFNFPNDPIFTPAVLALLSASEYLLTTEGDIILNSNPFGAPIGSILAGGDVTIGTPLPDLSAVRADFGSRLVSGFLGFESTSDGIGTLTVNAPITLRLGVLTGADFVINQPVTITPSRFSGQRELNLTFSGDNNVYGGTGQLSDAELNLIAFDEGRIAASRGDLTIDQAISFASFGAGGGSLDFAAEQGSLTFNQPIQIGDFDASAFSVVTARATGDVTFNGAVNMINNSSLFVDSGGTLTTNLITGDGSGPLNFEAGTFNILDVISGVSSVSLSGIRGNILEISPGSADLSTAELALIQLPSFSDLYLSFTELSGAIDFLALGFTDVGFEAVFLNGANIVGDYLDFGETSVLVTGDSTIVGYDVVLDSSSFIGLNGASLSIASESDIYLTIAANGFGSGLIYFDGGDLSIFTTEYLMIEGNEGTGFRGLNGVFDLNGGNLRLESFLLFTSHPIFSGGGVVSLITGFDPFFEDPDTGYSAIDLGGGYLNLLVTGSSMNLGDLDFVRNFQNAFIVTLGSAVSVGPDGLPGTLDDLFLTTPLLRIPLAVTLTDLSWNIAWFEGESIQVDSDLSIDGPGHVLFIAFDDLTVTGALDFGASVTRVDLWAISGSLDLQGPLNAPNSIRTRLIGEMITTSGITTQRIILRRPGLGDFTVGGTGSNISGLDFAGFSTTLGVAIESFAGSVFINDDIFTADGGVNIFARDLIQVNGVIGSIETPIFGGISLHSAGDIDINAGIVASGGDIELIADSGTAVFDTPSDGVGDLNVNAAVSALGANSSVLLDAGSFINYSGFIVAGGDVLVMQDLIISSLEIDFGGDLIFSGTVDSNSVFVDGILTAVGSGLFEAQQPIGAAIPLLLVIVEAPTINLSDVSTYIAQLYDGDVTAASDYNILLGGGAFAVSGSLTLLSDSTITAPGSGTISIGGPIDGPGGLTLDAGAGLIELFAPVGSTTPLAFLSATAFTISLSDVSTIGAQSYNGTVSFASSYLTQGGDFSLTGSLALLSDSSIDTAGGLITIDGPVEGPGGLTLDAGAGSISLSAAAGATTPLGALSATATTISLSDVSTEGDIFLSSSGDTSINGAVDLVNGGSLFADAAGTLTLNAITGDGSTSLDLAAGTYDLRGAITGMSDVWLGGTVDDPLVVGPGSADLSTAELALIEAPTFGLNFFDATFQGAIDFVALGFPLVGGDGTFVFDGAMIIADNFTMIGDDILLVIGDSTISTNSIDLDSTQIIGSNGASLSIASVADINLVITGTVPGDGQVLFDGGDFSLYSDGNIRIEGDEGIGVFGDVGLNGVFEMNGGNLNLEASTIFFGHPILTGGGDVSLVAFGFAFEDPDAGYSNIHLGGGSISLVSPNGLFDISGFEILRTLKNVDRVTIGTGTSAGADHLAGTADDVVLTTTLLSLSFPAVVSGLDWNRLLLQGDVIQFEVDFSISGVNEVTFSGDQITMGGLLDFGIDVDRVNFQTVNGKIDLLAAVNAPGAWVVLFGDLIATSGITAQRITLGRNEGGDLFAGGDFTVGGAGSNISGADFAGFSTTNGVFIGPSVSFDPAVGLPSAGTVTINDDITVADGPIIISAVNLIEVNGIIETSVTPNLGSISLLSAGDITVNADLVANAGNIELISDSGSAVAGVPSDGIGVLSVNAAVSALGANSSVLLDAGSFINYSGSIVAGGDVLVMQDLIISSLEVDFGGDLIFSGTVDGVAGESFLTVSGAGLFEARQPIGATIPLLSVIVVAPTISLSDVTTFGSQIYTGAVSFASNYNVLFEDGAFIVTGSLTLLSDSTILAPGGSTISIGGPIDGPGGLTLYAGAGSIELFAPVGSTTPLAFLSAAAFTILLSDVSTVGAQTYSGAIGATLTSSAEDISLLSGSDISVNVDVNLNSFSSLFAEAAGTLTLNAITGDGTGFLGLSAGTYDLRGAITGMSVINLGDIPGNPLEIEPGGSDLSTAELALIEAPTGGVLFIGTTILRGAVDFTHLGYVGNIGPFVFDGATVTGDIIDLSFYSTVVTADSTIAANIVDLGLAQITGLNGASLSIASVADINLDITGAFPGEGLVLFDGGDFSLYSDGNISILGDEAFPFLASLGANVGAGTGGVFEMNGGNLHLETAATGTILIAHPINTGGGDITLISGDFLAFDPATGFSKVFAGGGDVYLTTPQTDFLIGQPDLLLNFEDVNAFTLGTGISVGADRLKNTADDTFVTANLTQFTTNVILNTVPWRFLTIQGFLTVQFDGGFSISGVEQVAFNGISGFSAVGPLDFDTSVLMVTFNTFTGSLDLQSALNAPAAQVLMTGDLITTNGVAARRIDLGRLGDLDFTVGGEGANISGLDLAGFSTTEGLYIGAGATSPSFPATVTINDDIFVAGGPIIITARNLIEVNGTIGDFETPVFGGVSLFSAGDITINADIVTEGGDIELIADSGTATFGVPSDGIGVLNVNANVLAIGTNDSILLDAGSVININPSPNTTVVATGDVAVMQDLILTGSHTFSFGGDLIFSGTVDAGAGGGLTVFGGGLFEAQQPIGATNPLDFLNIDAATINLSDVSTVGAQIYTGAVSFASSYLTQGGDLTLSGSLALLGDASIDTAGGLITIDGPVDGPGGLTLDAGTGSISLSAAAGATTPLGALSATATTISLSDVSTVGAQTYNGAVSFASSYLTQGGDLTLSGSLALLSDSSIQTSGGLIAIDGPIDGPGGLTLDAGTGSISLSAAAGATTPLGALFATATTISLSDVSTVGAQTYNGAVSFASSYLTQGGNLTLTGSLALLSDASIDTAGGLIAIDGPVDGPGGLTLDAGAGSIELSAAAGATTPLGALFATATTISLSDVTTVGAQTYNGTVSFASSYLTQGGDFIVTGDLALLSNVSINTGGGNIDILAVDSDGTPSDLIVNAVTGSITFGSIGQTGALNNITLTGNIITVSGATDAGGTILITASGDVTLVGGGSAGSLDVTSPGAIRIADVSDPEVLFSTTGTQAFDGQASGDLVLRFEASELILIDLRDTTVTDAAATLLGSSTLNTSTETLTTTTVEDAELFLDAVSTANPDTVIGIILPDGTILLSSAEETPAAEEIVPVSSTEEIVPPEAESAVDFVSIEVNAIVDRIVTALTVELPGAENFSPAAAVRSDGKRKRFAIFPFLLRYDLLEEAVDEDEQYEDVEYVEEGFWKKYVE